MKKITFLVYIVCMSFTLFAQSKVNSENELNKETGILKLIAPHFASIYINDKPSNNEKEIKLTPGKYVIRITAKNCISKIDTLEINAGDNIVKQYYLKHKEGILSINVNPDYIPVVIFRNHDIVYYEIRGYTSISHLRIGDYNFTFKAAGYKDQKVKVSIKEDKELKLNIDLEKDPNVTRGMVLVDGGTFTRDSVDVTLSSFYIDKFEITQKQWIEVMGSNPSYTKGDDLPVDRVSWYQAIEFCNKLSEKEGLTPVYDIKETTVTCNWESSGYRLPTEAEWEYAARGGQLDDSKYYSGVSYELHLYRSILIPYPNSLGIYHMTGSVWEWCWDWYTSYPSESSTNPRGPETGTYKVTRGGSRFYGNYRNSARNFTDPNYIFELGLRVVKSFKK
jgi:formylglycine-generating enzyme required for sulfatase activity